MSATQKWIARTSGEAHEQRQFLEKLLSSIYPTETEKKIRRLCSSSIDFILTIVLTDVREVYVEHLPHFSEHFLFAISIKLWSQLINPFNIHTYCPHVNYIYGFHVTAQTSVLFRRYSRLSWISGFVDSLTNAYGYPAALRVYANQTRHKVSGGEITPYEETLVWKSTPYKNTTRVFRTMENNPIQPSELGSRVYNVILPFQHAWFFHPADAFTTSTTVLKVNPKTRRQVDLAGAMKILVLNRGGSRAIANPNEIMSYLQNSFHKKINSAFNATDFSSSHVKMVMNEGKTFQVQIKPFALADIVIAIHGAGTTNIAFMRPCSIFIEVFPWRYKLLTYFHGLANNTGLVHEWWEAERPATFPSSFGKHNKKCRTTFYSMWAEFGKNETHDNIMNQNCMTAMDCKVCGRSVPDVNISLSLLEEKLVFAMKKRKQCILDLKGMGVFV
jgi:hypothetical protein